MRKPLQGVWNIIRFNWQFYVLSICFVLFLFGLKYFVDQQFYLPIKILILIIVLPVLISLFVSLYVYDLSSLYSLKWLNKLNIDKKKILINIHAGFDETSILLNKKFSDNDLIVYDFYNPQQHTEMSIKRARKAYPPYPNTKQISTSYIPLQRNYVDYIFLIFAAHEIRDDNEKIIFFSELNRILNSNGKIIITEHLRDISNFVAYNIGFFHFFGKHTWFKIFKKSNFIVSKKLKITPFITTFILEKNGNAS